DGTEDDLAEYLLGLSDTERRSLVPLLTEIVRRPEGLTQRRPGALAVAGAACLPTATQLAGWLRRRALADHRGSPEPVIRVLTGRGVPWFAEVATRVAADLPPRATGEQWRFAAALVTASGADVPAGEEFARGWAEDCFQGSDGDVAQRLRTDPFRDVLL